MVILRILYLLLFCWIPLSAADVQITAEIDNGRAYEGSPISGTITITHPDTSEIDLKSFQIDNKSLKVDLLKTVKISPQDPLTVTFFKFNLPAQTKGIHLLSPITVQVGKQNYTTYPITYEVMGGQTVTPQAQAQPGNVSPFLKVENLINGPTSLFPGQRTTVGYRLSFNTSIDTQKEEYPLLEAKGFRKIGDKNIQDFQQGATSIQEITQLIEALTPGNYTYGPSFMEGRAYREVVPGQPQFYSPPLHSDAPEVQLTVKPFPEEGKPASFTGSVGPLTMQVNMTSPPSIDIGDKIALKIEISGDVELENVTLPDLCCQPGFSGFFKAGDLPPAGTIEGKTKKFLAQLRPLTSTIRAIPPIEFSYFDPKTEKYVTLKSKEIALTVKPAPKEPSQEKAPEKSTPPEPPKAPPIEILGNSPLTVRNTRDLFFGTWNVMIWIPFGIFLLILQIFIKEMIEEQKRKVVLMNSNELVALAQEKAVDPQKFYYYINRALMRYLNEQGELKDINTLAEDLPETGLSGKVRQFLVDLEHQRFSGQEQRAPAEIIKQVSDLLKEQR